MLSEESGNDEQALANYRQEIDQREKLLTAQPQMTQHIRNLAQAYGWRADAHDRMGQTSEATHSRRRATELWRKITTEPVHRGISPILGDAYNSLAWGELLQGEPQAALADIEQAIQADPNQLLFRINRAHVLLKLGRYEQACSEYQLYKDRDLGGETGAAVVQRDFDFLQRADRPLPRMQDVRKLLNLPTSQPTQ
jgi:tetratricopeptide (TPR) repeat protein